MFVTICPERWGLPFYFAASATNKQKESSLNARSLPSRQQSSPRCLQPRRQLHPDSGILQSWTQKRTLIASSPNKAAAASAQGQCEICYQVVVHSREFGVKGRGGWLSPCHLQTEPASLYWVVILNWKVAECFFCFTVPVWFQLPWAPGCAGGSLRVSLPLSPGSVSLRTCLSWSC